MHSGFQLHVTSCNFNRNKWKQNFEKTGCGPAQVNIMLQWTPLAIVATTAAFGMLALVLLATAASSLAEYFFMYVSSMKTESGARCCVCPLVLSFTSRF